MQNAGVKQRKIYDVVIIGVVPTDNLMFEEMDFNHSDVTVEDGRRLIMTPSR